MCSPHVRHTDFFIVMVYRTILAESASRRRSTRRRSTRRERETLQRCAGFARETRQEHAAPILWGRCAHQALPGATAGRDNA
jgi:hypothetical protein